VKGNIVQPYPGFVQAPGHGHQGESAFTGGNRNPALTKIGLGRRRFVQPGHYLDGLFELGRICHSDLKPVAP
jgi:hypothetical protein